jgi:ubiquinone/menaquinone biosynthesis C-methylase UbiE
MLMAQTNYNELAATYDERYKAQTLIGVGNSLQKLIDEIKPISIIEIGCGTCNWLKNITVEINKKFGLDFSFEMLRMGKALQQNLSVVNGDAVRLPIKASSFDLIFCVNAIHHFLNKNSFLDECKRTLRPDGIVAFYGVDPHKEKDWYIYDYFNGVLKNDLERFPSFESLITLLKTKGFSGTNLSLIEKVYHKRVGDNVFNDPFIQKYSNSQLANLSDEEYQNGIEKIKIQIQKDPNTKFVTSLNFYQLKAKILK